MKAKQHWNRRVLSFLLALAMVVTQLGVWNAGKESVQAAETEVYKADFSDYSVADWSYKWSSTTDDTTFKAEWNKGIGNEDAALSVWTKTAQNLDMTHTVSDLEAGNYYVSVKTNGSGLNSGEIAIEADNQKQSAEVSFEKPNESTTYKTTKALTVSAGATITISISMNFEEGGYGYLDDITLTRAENEQTNEATTRTLYFKYTGNGTPAILFWNLCGESLEPQDISARVEVNNGVYYEMQKASASGWYQLTMKYKANEVKNQGVGFDIVELSADKTSEVKLHSYDFAYNNSANAYTAIFDGSYTDPAIIQDDYETVVSYEQALEDEATANVVQNAAVEVKMVKNLSDDFIMGMDISSMISELESGVVYRDYDGNELKTLDDICRFIKEQGINHIRVRVWNNPYDANGNGYGGGNNDVAKAKEFADACRSAGLKMLVDFHCSDLWTDPGKQQEPKAWKGYTLEQKKEALNTYITKSLNTIDPSKDVVDMVQVGNETTGGFIGETNVSNMCVLFSAGAAGVKTYNLDVKVVIHVESPHKRTMVTWAENLQNNNVDYDILATSYYPYWHGTLDNLKQQFETVKNTYCKDVMVAETSYAYTLEDSDGHANTVRVGNNDNGADTTEPFTEQGQATAIRNLINTVNEAGGLGVYYWEPAWLTVGNTKGLTGDAYNAQVKENQEKWEKYGSGWASSYANEYDSKDAGKWYGGSAVDNEAMFYPDGTATPALHVWNYVKTGAVSNLVSVEGFDSALTQTITAGRDFTLPDSVEITYSDSKTPVAEAVTWDEASVKKADMSKPGTYQISGTVSLSKEITRGAYKGKTSVDVTLTLQVKYANLITNKEAVEFDSGEYFTVDGTTFKGIPSAENAKSGKNSMGWYGASAANGSVTYKEVITLEKGTYTLEAYAQGAQSDVTMQILNAEDESVLFTGEATAMTAWGDWHTPKVTFTLDKTKSVKLRVCVEHEDGGWGAVDVLYLHKDASSSEGKDDTNTSGSSSSGGSSSGSAATVTPSDDTKKDDKPEQTTESKRVTATTASGEKAEVTVTVTKDTAGKVTEASAEVTGTKAEISADMVSRIVETAGTDHVAITANVTDKEGNIRYTVTADAKDLTAGKKLSVVVVDKKTGAYKLVNAKTYTVGKDGTLHVNLAAGSDYRMLSAAEIKNVEKAVLKTVAVKKTTASIKEGKNTKIQLSSKLDLDNVKKITYTSGKKSVAVVDKNGKITAKKKGTVTIKAKVTLKNGKTKTVSMKIKVK